MAGKKWVSQVNIFDISQWSKNKIVLMKSKSCL